MDDALMRDDGIDMIVVELDRCSEVTQDQDKASKIEKALFETRRDAETETTFMSYVARRKLNFQQLENAPGTSLPAVINCYATLRDAKLAESSYDKVVMWTGGCYDKDDVVRALVRLRPGTSGQNGKTVPKNFTDPEADAPTLAPGSDVWIQPGVDRPREDGETTIARDRAIVIPGVFYITDDGQEATAEENEVPQKLLQARLAFRHPGHRAVQEEVNAAWKARGFFGCRRGAGGRKQGPRMKSSSTPQLELRTRCARCRKLALWARECSEGNGGQRNDERHDRREGRLEDSSKGFIAVAGPTEQRLFFLGATWTWMLDPGGTRRGTATETVGQAARGIRSPRRMESGETRIRML